MVRLIELVTIVSLVNFSQAASDEAGKKLLGLSKVSRNTGLNSRSLLQKRCQGTCSECFGAGYMSCPGSDYLCYLPGDPNYGIDSCSGSGSATTAAPSPTTTGSAGNSDFCSGQDATCTSCFGPGYLPCSDGKSCCKSAPLQTEAIADRSLDNPADPDYDTCPDGSGASGGTGSGSSSCASQYGSGSIPCGSDACYNPDEGEVCCSGGYHCFSGQTCSSTIGKCCNSVRVTNHRSKSTDDFRIQPVLAALAEL